MPHVSRNKLDSKTEKEMIMAFESVLTRIGKMKKMDTFLYSLLSNTERVMLAKRLGIALLISENVSETEIANLFHVTRQTVYRIKDLKDNNEQGFTVALSALKKDKQLKEAKKFFLGLIKYSVRAAGGRVTAGIVD